MKGIIGKKVGMTSYYNEDGRNVPCTVIEAGPCVVTQIRDEERDGYSAVQLGFDEKKDKTTPSALQGHFDKNNVSPRQKIMEFRDFEIDVQEGSEVKADIFEAGEPINVVGTTKGKGFQGGMKRHGFSGVGMQTHGQHNDPRSPGSIGGASDPSRVYKGLRMAGRTGGKRTKMKNLKIEQVFPDKNLLVISGGIPGAKGSYVVIESRG